MEGIYTKLATIIAVIGLLFTIWQLIPKRDKKIDGEWTMISIVREADLKKYIGIEIKWKLFLTENDQKIKGTAEKIEINNEELDYNLRTTLEIEGNIKDDVITLNYIENGKLRKTSGIINATLNDNEFIGWFSQTASNTNGEIKGFKMIK